jgi:hypothetical protein
MNINYSAKARAQKVLFAPYIIGICLYTLSKMWDFRAKTDTKKAYEMWIHGEKMQMWREDTCKHGAVLYCDITHCIVKEKVVA